MRTPFVGGDVAVAIARLAKIHGLISAARAHHAGHPERARASLDVVRKQEVAVADDGHGNGRRDLADRVPVGREAIARVARAAVHEQRVGAAVDRGLRLLEVLRISRSSRAGSWPSPGCA